MLQHGRVDVRFESWRQVLSEASHACAGDHCLQCIWHAAVHSKGAEEQHLLQHGLWFQPSRRVVLGGGRYAKAQHQPPDQHSHPTTDRCGDHCLANSRTDHRQTDAYANGKADSHAHTHADIPANKDAYRAAIEYAFVDTNREPDCAAIGSTVVDDAVGTADGRANT